MKGLAPAIIIILVFVLALFSLFSDQSYAKLSSLEESLHGQRIKNQELESYVHSLKSDVHGVATDDRALEKTARNELGMARENEMIFIFEKDEAESDK